MNRLWLAVISGLVLGFVLMGMMLRGCEATADQTPSTLAPATTIAAGPVSHLAIPKSIASKPAVEIRSTFGSPTRAVTPRTKFNPGVTANRGADQQLNRGLTTKGQGLDVARALALSRQSPRSRQSTPQPNTGSTVADEFARRAAITGRGTPDATSLALQARVLAQSELLIQMELQRGPRTAQDLRDQLEGGLNPDANSDTGSSAAGVNVDPGDDPNSFFFAQGSRAAAITTNANPGGVTGSSTTGSSTTPPPIDANPIGDDTTPPTLPPGLDLPPGFELPPGIDLPPTDDTTNDPGADTPPPTGPAIISRWEPIQIDSTCADLTTVRTNDLFLGFRDPIGLQIITSAPPVSLNIVGGSFRQDPVNGNTPPTTQTLDLFPCAAFDSYLAVADETGLLFPVAPNANDWGAELNAVWGTPTTQPFGVVGIQNPERFGDDRYYVRIGRFTASANPDFVGGSIVVNAFDTSNFSVTTEVVPVDYLPELWTVEGIEPTSVNLASFAFTSSSIQGGGQATGLISLSAPAPQGGVEIALTSSSAQLTVPATVTIPAGETSATFAATSTAVGATTTITVSATLDATTIFSTLTINPAPTQEILHAITVTPSIVRGGLTSLGRVLLASPAPAGGVKIFLSSDDLSLANLPATVLVDEGQTQATFDIQTAPTLLVRHILIWGFVQDQVRTASLTVTVPSDLTGDGLIDGADLAMLLTSFDSDNPNADLNNDGAVNGADLAILLVNFNNSTPSDGDPFTGAVIARWVPVAIPAGICPELDAMRSNDLYFGFTLRPDVPGGPIAASQNASTLTITSGSFYQNPLGSNGPASDAIINLFPCLAFDSYLTIGGASPLFTPGAMPDPNDWGSVLNAQWFSTDFDNIFIEQNPAKFGDSRFYVRIGRFTADVGARVDGEIVATYTVAGVLQPITAVTVPNCPVCWMSFDLNEDGAVDSGDVEFVMTLLGTDDSRADLDRDGMVTAADVALIVDEATTTPPTQQ